MNTLQLIIENGLSVRRIPLKVSSLYCITHHKEGNEIVKHPLDMKHINYRPYKEKRTGDSRFEFDDENQLVYRFYSRETRTPVNAGKWMAKRVEDTSSMVQWNTKTDNLSDTLDEAVSKAINN